MAKTGASRSGLANVVEDTTPQLGGDLDVNGKKFTGAVSVAENMSYNSSGQNFSTASKTLVDCTATNTLSYANTTVRVFANTGTYNATATQLIGQFYVVDTTGSIIKNDPALTGYLPITYLFNSGGTYKGDTNATSALVIRDFVGNSTFNTVNGGTLAVGEYTAFLSQGKVETGATITTYRAFWATNLPTVSGTITNQIGIDIDAITKATTLAVGLRIGQPTTATTNRALQLTGTGTTVAGGIQFGGTSDTTNIYRSAASTLKTDGNLIVGTAGTAAGSAATVDGSQTLTNKTLSTGSVIDANVTVTEVLKKVYPIGCIYTSTNSTNPATSLGFGTWSAFGAGRVPVGFDSGQTEFDTDEETGGAKTHTHDLGAGTGVALVALGSTVVVNKGKTAPSSYTESFRVGGSNGTEITQTEGSALAGDTAAGSSLQPYIVVRMWKRTA